MPAKPEELRHFLKDRIRKEIDFSQTDQHLGVRPPLTEKPAPKDAVKIDLPAPGKWTGIAPVPVEEAIARRVSHRKFSPASLTLDELAFLLWATQGVRGRASRIHALRTVPSAGCRHSFETYLAVFRVDGLDPGLYRYLPLSHELYRIEETPEAVDAAGLAARVSDAALGQSFAGGGAVTFFWTTIPYRMEWRYGPAAHKVIAVDAGHVCQNLYLACEAVGAGTCAIAAYDQDLCDELLSVDGRDEFTVYLAPVGKVEKAE
ncbi:MAG: SagB/ThcOx family dehydrogenase [Spirochaetia bacterium]